MKKATVAETVRALLQPEATAEGLSLWDVEYVKEGATMILRITIDKPEGITIEDCERFHRAIDPLLDEADPIEDSYTLEVSSPGIERELKTPEHFAACEGCEVELRLFAAYNGAKSFTGELLAADEAGHIRLQLSDGRVLAFERNLISKAQTVFHFDD